MLVETLGGGDCPEEMVIVGGREEVLVYGLLKMMT